jgi:hypothetical protein
MFHDLVEKKIDELLELLRPKVKQPEPDQWDDVTVAFDCDDLVFAEHIHKSAFRVRKIDGLHNGPAFVVERKKP